MGAIRCWNIDFLPSRYLVGSFAFVKIFPCPLSMCPFFDAAWLLLAATAVLQTTTTQTHILRKSPYGNVQHLRSVPSTILNSKRMNYEKPIRFKHTLFFLLPPNLGQCTCTFSKVVGCFSLFSNDSLDRSTKTHFDGIAFSAMLAGSAYTASERASEPTQIYNRERNVNDEEPGNEASYHLLISCRVYATWSERCDLT